MKRRWIFLNLRLDIVDLCPLSSLGEGWVRSRRNWRARPPPEPPPSEGGGIKKLSQLIYLHTYKLTHFSSTLISKSPPITTTSLRFNLFAKISSASLFS